MSRIIIRVFLYLLFALALAQVIHFEVKSLPEIDQFSEWGYVEPVQAIMLALSALFMWLASRVNHASRELALCIMMCFLVLLIRENDQVLELFLPHGIWKYFALPIVLYLGWFFFRNREVITFQLEAFSRTAPFGVFISSLVVLGFSRLFGATSLWTGIMGDGYIRVVKNAAEEGVEFLALGLFLVASIEAFLAASRHDSE